ncbi:MAG: LarC family nickel insertion protein [Lachnospiraceae bacterium]|nr:LarC family nickel insertion protein [Lachnospiraceae bacterium]
MGNILYFECASGISGDMTAAALLDLGADRERLEKVLSTIPANGFEIKISRVKKSGIDCMDFDVAVDEEHETHDHDMEWLYGHEHGDHDHGHDDHGHDHDHKHKHKHHDDDDHKHKHKHHDDHDHKHKHHDHDDHEHHHDHDHHHDHHHDHDHDHHGHDHHHDHGHDHHHEHRNMSDIMDVINRTEMDDEARKLAVRIFEILAEAESKAHGIDISEVHFHEVGAVDSIADIIAIAECFTDICRKHNVTDVIVKGVSEGHGTVRTQHGILPVPVPAVVNIAKSHGIPMRTVNQRGELVTPTGAAFLAAVKTGNRLPETTVIREVGLGAGKREYELPGFLRVMIVEPGQA